MKGKAKVRMICIMAGSVLAAVLVPLAVRARVAAPRPVAAPPLAYTRWEGRVWVSDNGQTQGMHFYPALAARGEYVYAMWSKQGSPSTADFDPTYNWSDSYGSAGDGWDNTDANIQPNTRDTVNVDLAVDSANDLHFVWAEATGTPSYTLYYSYKAASPGTIATTNKQGMVPAIAVGSSNVYVVWSEGSGDIKYSDKPLASGSWSGPTTVRSSTGDPLANPAIAVEGSTVHVAWNEGDLDDADILYKKCCPWSSNPITVSHDVALASFGPALAVRGSDVYAVWCEYDADAPDTQYIRFGQSGDGGSNWGGSQQISGGALAPNAASPWSLRPDVAVDMTGTLHVVFDGSPGGVYENIYYVSNAGSGWSSRLDVSEKALPIGALAADANSTTPAIAVSGAYVHVIWMEQCIVGPGCGAGEYEVIYRRRVSMELGEGVYLPIILKSW
jgi:hypothetical protein